MRMLKWRLNKMANIKFKRLGGGWMVKTKSGKKAINLKLDPELCEAVPKHDWKKGVYIFKNTYKKSENDPDFSVHAPVDISK